MEKSSIIQIHLGADEVIEKKKKRVNNKPRFRMIGANKMDAIKLLTTLTPQEAYAFQEIVNRMTHENNFSYVSQKDKTPTQAKQFSLGYRRLKAKDMVTRLKKGQPSLYMVNPDLILPTDYDESCLLWLRMH